MNTQPMTAELIEALPIPPKSPDLSWRPIRREDLPALHHLLLAADQVDNDDAAGTLEDMQTQFDDPWLDPATDSLLALTPDGQAVAMARSFANPQPEEESRCFLWEEVHPDWRGCGLEDFLLDWLEARGAQRLRAIAPDRRRLLRRGYPDTLTDRIARVEQRGFQPERYFYRMRRDLSEPIPDRPLADGLQLRAFEAELSERVMDAFNEAFRDHWSNEPVTPEEWQMFFLERSSFRPDLSFVVLDGEEVAGVSFNTVSPEEIARQGINQGWVAELGVRRPWRKRGVATALLCESMRAFKRAGLDFATLGVDTENPSGALRLYESVGFRPVRRFIVFSKPVP